MPLASIARRADWIAGDDRCAAHGAIGEKAARAEVDALADALDYARKFFA